MYKYNNLLHPEKLLATAQNMEIKELNKYLSKLEGSGTIEVLNAETDSIMFKFSGSTGGPYDDGEIEITFIDVEVINLPLSMILPASIEVASSEELTQTISVNYRWGDRTLFKIKDATNRYWHVYAGSYSVKILPVFWERPDG